MLPQRLRCGSRNAGPDAEPLHLRTDRLPLLGPLHVIFDKIAPGFARDTASRLEMNHALNGEMLAISDLTFNPGSP